MSKQQLFRVGTGAIIVKDDTILLGLRGPKARDQHNKWELLGGLVDFNESPEEAIVRIVGKEEAGIVVEPIDIIGTNVRYSEDNDKEEEWVGLTYLCQYVSGEPKQTEFDRVIDHKWHTLESALKADLTPMTRLQLEQYQAWLERNKK
jgi:ADP-ribose pyrophosphatase YjhB (NUDIX family)